MSTDPNQHNQQPNAWYPVDGQMPASQPSAEQPYFDQQAASPFAPAPVQPMADPTQQFPASQPSAQVPAFQPSAPAGWENTGQIPQGYPSAAQYDEYTGVVPGMTGLNRPVAPQAPKPQNPVIAALTDFSFTKFGARQLAGLAYLFLVLWVVLSWIKDVIYGFTGPLGSEYAKGNIYDGMGALLLGWIPGLMLIIGGRILLEFLVSGVEHNRAEHKTEA